jgi:Fe2+ or Zn2+ uptake regulation protein
MVKEEGRKVSSKSVLYSSSKRVTSQRTLLLDIIRQNDSHLDADELYRIAKEKNKSISLSTVYRNLQLFKKLKLVEERHFDEGHHHYEVKPADEHQHLICTACGKVIEFTCPLCQKLRDEMGREYDFDITGVEVSMSGVCPECRQQREKRE